MTGNAIGLFMHPRYRERRRMGVGRFGPGAVGGMVAQSAIGAKSGQNMIGIFRLGHFGFMAPFAIQRCAGKLIITTFPVARFAIGDGMDAGQSESFLGVHLQQVFPPLPVLGRMAVLAIGAELPQMMIAVAVGASRRHMAEDFVFMAGGARGRLMRAGQVEAGLVMLELHRLLHRSPGIGRMAVLTVPFDGAMRILRHGLTHKSACNQSPDNHDCCDMPSHDFPFSPVGMVALWQEAQLVPRGLYKTY